MHIISKILGESQIYFGMKLSFARIGKVGLLSLVMRKDVNALKNVLTVMAGKSNSSILSFIKPSNAMN
jgi:hypothetical protein